MNKAEFIEKLSSSLAILTEDERQDILDEYEQHIDIKVTRGMSEEAAIADFGRIEDLVADILAAYHVRISEAKTDSSKKTDQIYKGIWYKVRSLCGRIWDFGKRTGHSICNGMKKAGNACCTGMAKMAAFCRKPFHKQKAEEAETSVSCDLVRRESKQHRERKDTMRDRTDFAVVRAVGKLFRICAEAVKWCLKWIWNLFWIGSGVLFGSGSFFMIFIMGVLVVLLAMSYPLIGVSIGCLGVILCMVSVTIWCFSLIIKSNRKPDQEEKDSGDIPVSEEAAEEEMFHA